MPPSGCCARATCSPTSPSGRRGGFSPGDEVIRFTATVSAVNDARTSCPALRALANHRDPVTTNHLPGGEPESAAKTRTARLRRST